MKKTSPKNRRASKPSAHPQRPAAARSKPKTVTNAAGRSVADLGPRRVVMAAVPPGSADNINERIGEIHKVALGAIRCAKATVEFARTAGQRLVEARAALGNQGFEHWVDRTLAITPADARGLIDFVADPEVATAAISPTDAVTLAQVVELVRRLDKQF